MFFELRKYFILILVLIISVNLFAQEIGSWNVIDFRKNTKKNISYQIEAQVRSLKFYKDFHYNELNFTSNYKFDNNLVVSILFGKHNTYSQGGNFKSPLVTDEYRFSIQAATSQKFGNFILDNRYRIEQRYFPDNIKYRMRYRFGLKSKITKVNQIQFSNEMFLSLNNSNSIFEKNRFLIGFTNTFNKTYELQINYLNQIDKRINDESGTNFLQIVNIINL
jgi:hypothetical protein